MMLRRFVDLSDGDFIIQNGANSAVGACFSINSQRFGEMTPRLR